MKVRTAILGKTGRHGIITRQTYAEGVLLESSNTEYTLANTVTRYTIFLGGL